MAALVLAGTPAFAQEKEDLDSQYAVSLVKAGTDAPALSLKSMDGKAVSLSDYKGKWVVLDFWASWCPDCRKDIPDVVRLYKKFHPKGVEFIGISFDTDRAAWEKAVKDSGLEWTQTCELVRMSKSAVAQSYGVGWIPSMVIVDPDGKVSLSTVTLSKAEAALEKAFPEKK